jgi:hypothetical protein
MATMRLEELGKFFFYFLQIYDLLYKLSNKQICYKETLVRSNHPMMILLCTRILYATLLPLSGPLSGPLGKWKKLNDLLETRTHDQFMA